MTSVPDTAPETETQAQRFSGEWLAAGLVHAYTATGAVLALLMIRFIHEHHVSTVLWLFLAAMVIDATDGLLARRFRVKEVMPGFDGALLDNIVDYLTYVFAPVLFLQVNGYFPDGTTGTILAAIPILASCYQFCRSDAKTDDHFFLGFPSYWNIVAFYAVVMRWDSTTTSIVVLICSVLVFVPIKYVYPSRTERLWYLNMTLAALWLVAFALITAALPNPPGWLVWASLLYPAYYVVISLWLTAKTRRR